MKISTPFTHRKARLEIIPLIDIMFFLLASFMLVSLTMTKQRTVEVNLPAAASADPSLVPDTLTLGIDAAGQVFVEHEAVALQDLELLLRRRLQSHPDLPVYVSGDAATPHGAMVAVLDFVRRCGITKVAFNVRTLDSQP